MKTVIAIQARLASVRLPRKILMDVNGKPMISHLYRRCSAVENAESVVIACPEDDRIDIGKETLLPTVGGPEVDVLTRLLNVAKQYEADRLVRVTGDCPLIPPDLIRHMIDQANKHFPEYDVVQNWKPRCHPDGFDCEVWDVSFLKHLSNELTKEGDREWFAQKALESGTKQIHVGSGADYSRIRLTVDYPEDLEIIRAIYKDMGDEVWGAELIHRWVISHKRLMMTNAKYVGSYGARPKK